MALYCLGCLGRHVGHGPDADAWLLHDPDCPPGHMFQSVCEGCGPGWFDRDGWRVHPEEEGESDE